MSVRVSTSSLAAAVADCGGIGTIGGSGIPIDELKEDIRKAKRMTNGIVAVNIMFAVKQFMEAVKASIEAGVDMIFTGAGFSRDVFKVGKDNNVPIVSIVSSPEFGKLAERSGADAIVVEAKEAGFSADAKLLVLTTPRANIGPLLYDLKRYRAEIAGLL